MDLQLQSTSFAEDSLGVWRDIACDLFVPLQIDAVGQKPFSWQVFDAGFGDVALTDLAISPQDVQRSQRHIGNGSAEYFLLSVQVEGLASISQDGRQVGLAPGDSVLYDTLRPYRLSFERDMRQHILRIPRDIVLSAIPDMGDAVARRIPGSFPLGMLLGSTVGHYIKCAQTLQEDERVALSSTLVDLLTVTVGKFDTIRSQMEPQGRASTRARVDAFIAAHLGDDHLDVAAISKATGLNTRYLHRLFKETGSETISRFIMRCRLEHCAAELADCNQRKSITELCLDWGFTNSAHFSRSFRSEYGCTPRDYRKRAMTARATKSDNTQLV